MSYETKGRCGREVSQPCRGRYPSRKVDLAGDGNLLSRLRTFEGGNTSKGSVVNTPWNSKGCTGSVVDPSTVPSLIR